MITGNGNWQRASSRTIMNGRVMDAQPDVPDFRDWIYQPPLVGLKSVIRPDASAWWSSERVRDQGSDPSCTGHALAAAIDHLLAIRLQQGNDLGASEEIARKAVKQPFASALMLYGNAKLHDEWHGEAYSGSSLRGAIKGFYHNGVCSIDEARKACADNAIGGRGANWRWHSNRCIHERATRLMLGAYYRIRPSLADLHSALTQAHVLLVSADIHKGWFSPEADGTIAFEPSTDTPGRPLRHAFVIVGYDQHGFWIQNSWGRSWGADGLGRWSYPDWARNVFDIWGLRLAVPASEAQKWSFGLHGVHAGTALSGDPHRGTGLARPPEPSRPDVLGHLVLIQDGRLMRYGRFHSDRQTLRETFEIILRRVGEDHRARSGGKKYADAPTQMPADTFRYRHVLLHFMGGGRTDLQAASMIRSLVPVYKANGIYPLFFLWEPVLFQELLGKVHEIVAEMDKRTGRHLNVRADLNARLIETEVAKVPGRLRREIERASRRFLFLLDDQPDRQWEQEPTEGVWILSELFTKMAWRHRNGSLSYHFACHGLGARVIFEFFKNNHLLGKISCRTNRPVISSVNLIAPFLSKRRFLAEIAPRLIHRNDGRINRRARLEEPLIERINLFHLDAQAETADKFCDGYNRSWPELWARVIGLMDRWDHPERNELFDRVSEPGSYEQVYISPQLSLEKYAKELEDEMHTHGRAFERIAVNLKHEHQHAPDHFNIDAQPEVLNAMLACILGGQDKVAQVFTTTDCRVLT